MKGLLDRIGFAFQVNYHSNGQWLLYAEGWQIGTPTADDPIYYAMSGNLDKPAIDGLPPRPQLRRPLRHQRRDDRLRAREHGHAGLDAGAVRRLRRAAGSSSPTTRRWCRPSSSGTCRSRSPWRTRRPDPDDPKSVLGPDDQAVLPEERRPLQGRDPRQPTSRSPYSYGDPQPVAVIAKRSLGAVTAKWKVNGGAVQSAPTPGVDRREVHPGRRLLPPGPRRGHRGRTPGDSVEVWFEGGGQTSDVVHLPGGLRDRQQGPRGGGRGLHRRLAGPDARPAIRATTTSTP